MGKTERDRLQDVWSLWVPSYANRIRIRAVDSYCLCHLSSVAVTENHSLRDIIWRLCCS